RLEQPHTEKAKSSSIMTEAEDQAANVLKGNGRGAAGLAAAVAGGASATATTSVGATGPASAGGASAFAGAGANIAGPGGSGESGPNFTPPDTSKSLSETLNQLVDTGGMIGGCSSALEAGGAAAFSEGVVGTTIGSILLPIGAFKLGLAIGMEDQRREEAMDLFRMKLAGTATLDAVQSARAQMQNAGLS